MKIILADDHTLFRDGFVLLLKQLEAGAEVITAGSLEDALGQVRAHPDADLLLLDLQMPGMQGLASVRAVMRDFPSLPVAILSASDSLPVMEALLAAGAAGFIPKSSSAPVMLSALRLILAGGVYLPPSCSIRAKLRPVWRPPRAAPLMPRQLDVLRLLCEGKSNKLICREPGLGEGTVKAHIAAMFRALSVSNRTEAALQAKRLGLL